MLGSPDIPSGYTYFGSFAIAICLGPAKTLNRISNGDTDVWTGPIDISSADGNGKTTLTTTIGTIDFYWGTAGQAVNDLLNAISIDFGSGPVVVPMTAFRNLVYAVCRDVAFGGQVTPPTLKFDLATSLNVLSLSSHSIGGDAVLPEAIYDYLTNPLYGGSVKTSEIDAASFAAAAETTITEGLGASPSIDAAEPVRDTVGRMLQIIDGVIYFDGGKLKMKLVRQEDTSSAPSVSEADMLEEPQPNPQMFKDTWNVSRLVFRDSDNAWEETSEVYEDDANEAITQRTVSKDFQFPWITKRSSAKICAKLLGIRGGIPPIYWSLVLKPVWSTLRPGQLIKVSSAKRSISNRICRVVEVTRGGPEDPSVEVSVIEDQARDSSHDYVPPDDDFSIPSFLDSAGTGAFSPASTTARIAALPSGLRGGKSDGLVLVGNRPDAITSVLQLWWTYSPGVVAYQKLDQRSAFPAKGTVFAFWRINSGTWLFRVTMDTAQDLSSIIARTGLPELLAVLGERKYNTVTPKDQHQITAPWLVRPIDGRFTLLASNVVDIELSDGQFGGDSITLEDGASDANYPTAHVYFGDQSSFVIYPTDSIRIARTGGNASGDTAQVRYFKAPVQNPFASQTPADVAAVNLDKLTLTMSPDGTFSRDWGSRAPTVYEVLDIDLATEISGTTPADYATIADLETALGAVLHGTATADQALLVAHIDLVLGKLSETTQTWYSDE